MWEAGTPCTWDPVTDTAWTAYQVGAQWHETFYDDPTSLYQIAHLARSYGLSGVGAWALGMEGNNPTVVSALDGVLPAVHYATPGVPSTTATVPAAVPQTQGQTQTQGQAQNADQPARQAAPARVPAGAPITGGGASPPAAAASIVGVFEAGTLATIENANPRTSFGAGFGRPGRHALRRGDGARSARAPGDAAPRRDRGAAASRRQRLDLDHCAPGSVPPFPGATVAGLLHGVVVQNGRASCLEDVTSPPSSGRRRP